MKQAFLFFFSVLSLGAFAQTTGTFTYRIVDETDTLFFTIYATPDKIALDGKIESGMNEHVVIDLKQKKVLELLDDEEGNEAYESSWEESFDEEVLMMSEIAEFLVMGAAPKETYKILPDKKNIQGIACQKFVFLNEDDGSEMATGWFAPGLHIKLCEGVVFMELEEGVIINMQSSSEEGLFVFELAAYKKTIDNPTAAFSLVIPEGYELIDLDSLDSEIEETVEGEE